MKKLLWFCSAVFLLFAFSSCGKDNNGNEIPELPPINVEEGNDLYGLITDHSGTPVSGIVVSDGYQCVLTNGEGVYQMKKNEKATHVFYSLPSEYKVSLTESRYPDFWGKISTTYAHFRRDFKLMKGEKETDFTLICIGDPQVGSDANIERFIKETMPAVKRTAEASAYPSYALVLGDIVADKPNLLGGMRTHMFASGVPYYATIGNHDKVASGSTSDPRNASQFMTAFGPLNYSFNRGDVHFVCLDNVVYSNSSSYSGGLSAEQIEWLKADLSHVTKDKMIIIFYHIPIRGGAGNYTELINLVKDYNQVHFMAGHTHYSENYINSDARGKIYEHIHAASCGAWWHSAINGDGTPNGYAVYDVRGAEITNWHYKGSLLEADKSQIRLHKGSDVSGGTNGWFRYSDLNASFDANTVIANVFNADPSWEVRLYENGADQGQMTLLTGSVNDKWSVGYHVGVVGRNPANYTTACKHLYYKNRSSSTVTDAQIKVVAKDRFGNTYEQNKFTGQVDFTEAKSPAY